MATLLSCKRGTLWPSFFAFSQSEKQLFVSGSSIFSIFKFIMSDSEGGGDAKRGRARAKKAPEPRSDNSEEPKAKRGRGRPKGSAKKPKKAAAGKSPSGKRGRGRPPKKSVSKESKNSSDQGGSDASEGDD